MTFQILMQKGGNVSWVILGMSVASVTIILWKTGQFVYWWWIGLSSKNHPISKVLNTARCAIKENDEIWRDIVQTESSKQMAKVDSGLGAMSMIVQLCPLLGLLGTVTGMISAFHQLEVLGGRPDPAVLAGGIWEALLTTVMGLSVSIPTRIVLYGFDTLANKISAQIQHNLLEDTVCLRKMEGNTS